MSEASTTRRAKWDDGYAAKDLVWSAGPNERFAAEVNGLNPGKALDIACGEGRNALWLAEQGWDVTAIDFSQVALLYMHTDATERQKWLANTLAAVKSGGTFIYIGHDPSNIGAGRGGPQNPQYLPTAEELVSAMDGFSVQFAGVIERTVAS